MRLGLGTKTAWLGLEQNHGSLMWTPLALYATMLKGRLRKWHQREMLSVYAAVVDPLAVRMGWQYISNYGSPIGNQTTVPVQQSSNLAHFSVCSMIVTALTNPLIFKEIPFLEYLQACESHMSWHWQVGGYFLCTGELRTDWDHKNIKVQIH